MANFLLSPVPIHFTPTCAVVVVIVVVVIVVVVVVVIVVVVVVVKSSKSLAPFYSWYFGSPSEDLA